MTLLSMSNFAHAESHLLVFGGGGEPVGKNTIFDNGLMYLGNNVQDSKWKYNVSYNGGHSITEKILQTQFSQGASPATSFTRENFLNTIENYKKKILSNEIKSDDQLMIIISTHGAQRTNKELTHSISLAGKNAVDLNTLEGSDLVSLDVLQDLVKLTNERGIKLGIVDLSCHSGAMMALKKNAPNTCIISASGPNHFSFNGTRSFAENFVSNLLPGTSLETAYLQARVEAMDPSYPMISTIQNDQIVQNIYEGITPYLYYYDVKAEKLTSYMLDNEGHTQICKRENDFTNLISQIDALSNIMSTERYSADFDILKNLLIKYKKSQDEVLNTSKSMSIFELGKIETFSIPLNSRDLLSGFKVDYSWEELLEFDVDKRIAEYENYKKHSVAKKHKDDHQLIINFLTKVKEKKQ